MWDAAAATGSGLGLFSMLRRRILREDSVPRFQRGLKGGKFMGMTLRRYPSVRVRSFGLESSRSRSGRYHLGRDGIRISHQFGVLGRSRSRNFSANVQGGLRIGKVNKWWENGLQPNMKEVTGAEDLVESLLSAGDKLVVVHFYSPSCGGCKALHPKICQIAGGNPEVLFLQVNYEEHKSMCYSLGVHVLPFFRFYRGAQGRVCSFSCTVATIKKFKDAFAKHSPDRCSLGCTKGLEEKELMALASNKDLSFSYTPNLSPALDREHAGVITDPVPSHVPLDLPLPSANARSLQDSTQDPLVSIGR
ncbi:hypothetical protein MLD38_033263 [Melastoma candidum]|uniref:Uncharacterized protein n=1 Tax=Melastoma candidum TaxID=119954 RepID=A0ACB9M667_9MYRT|nr:hypothetical protein MLD38_033263 [Melastoma candidum]